MIMDRSINIAGELALMSVSPADVFQVLAEKKGGKTGIIRTPEFKIQNDILDDRSSRFKALNATRRGAKSSTEVMDHIEICQEYPKSKSVYMGLTLDSVTEICWDIFKDFNERYRLGLKFNNTKKIVFYPNGSRTRLFGLDASTRQMAKILGQKLRKASIDEAGSITIDLEEFCFQKVRPALIDLAPNSWLTLLGTCENIPNTYFEKVTKGLCEKFDWKIYRWTSYDNPFVAKQWGAEIDDITKRTPLALESSAFKTHYLNIWCSDDDLLIIPVGRMKFLEALPNLGRNNAHWIYMLGVDLGYNDATAYTLLAFNWHYKAAVVCMTFKATEQDLTDVANVINQMKEDYKLSFIVIDGANKQGVEEIKKRHNLHEIEIAEKVGKATYLRLLKDEVIQEKIEFIGGSCDDLKKEWSSLQWKDQMKIIEDPRCQNHLSDSTLYIWRKTYAMRADETQKPPRENDPEYEKYLENKIEQQDLEEQENEQEVYGTPEGDYFDPAA
jgi:hypothetical protein